MYHTLMVCHTAPVGEPEENTDPPPPRLMYNRRYFHEVRVVVEIVCILCLCVLMQVSSKP